MPKRPIYLQSPYNNCRRTRRDIEFPYDYWDRLLAPANQTRDMRFLESLRADHFMRYLMCSLPFDQGLRINVNFTILDTTEPNMYTDIYSSVNQ
jgi:hypothetical protein